MEDGITSTNIKFGGKNGEEFEHAADSCETGFLGQ